MDAEISLIARVCLIYHGKMVLTFEVSKKQLEGILEERGSRASSTDQDARCHLGMDGCV